MLEVKALKEEWDLCQSLFERKDFRQILEAVRCYIPEIISEEKTTYAMMCRASNFRSIDCLLGRANANQELTFEVSYEEAKKDIKTLQNFGWYIGVPFQKGNELVVEVSTAQLVH